MVSLLKLANIEEQGVNFLSPVDGKPMLLTPEESISIQNNLGMPELVTALPYSHPIYALLYACCTGLAKSESR